MEVRETDIFLERPNSPKLLV